MEKKNQIAIQSQNGHLSMVFNSKRIREAEPIEVVKVLKDVFYLIGLKNFPNEHEMQYLISFVLSDLKRFTLLDVSEAFKRIASGEINGELEHYNNFSPVYLGKTMRIYEAWKCKEVLEQKKKKEQLEKEKEILKEKNKTPMEIMEECKANYEALTHYVNDNKEMPLIWDWLGVYWYMDDKGLVTKDAQEKRMFADYVRNLIENEKKDAIANYGLMAGREIDKSLNDKVSFANRCRIEMVKSHFKQKLK